MKKLFLAALMAIMPAAMNAATQLVVTMTDNTKTTISLAEKPVMTFSATGLTITTADNTVKLTAERADVKDFTFSEVEGISTATIKNSVPAGLYDINGRLLQKGEINLKQLPAGNYILKNENGTSMKVLKK